MHAIARFELEASNTVKPRAPGRLKLRKCSFVAATSASGILVLLLGPVSVLFADFIPMHFPQLGNLARADGSSAN